MPRRRRLHHRVHRRRRGRKVGGSPLGRFARRAESIIRGASRTPIGRALQDRAVRAIASS